jgi:acetyl-CoA hydrolase
VLDLAAYLQPDDLVVIPQGTAEPLELTRRLVAGERQLPRCRVFLGTVYSDTFNSATSLELIAIGGLGSAHQLISAGRCDVVPCQISQLPGLFAGPLKPDVVLLHLSAEARHGRHSVGIVDDYLQAAISHARVILAQVNVQMPYTHGSTTISLDDLDGYEYVDAPLIEVPPVKPSYQAAEIGKLAAGLISDGSCLQVGLGAVPDAILRELHGHRDLGIHSGLLTDELLALHNSGAVTNLGKPEYQSKSVCGAAFGTHGLYSAMSQDSSVWMQPVPVTHGHDALARINKLVAINSAVEVDLTGQVNAEVAGQAYLGGTGGQVDFVRGAAASPGGRAIIALPSTDRHGRISRIVNQPSASVTTTLRSEADIIVTEYGVADMQGLTLAERRRKLISIAHPRFRDELMAAPLPPGCGHR